MKKDKKLHLLIKQYKELSTGLKAKKKHEKWDFNIEKMLLTLPTVALSLLAAPNLNATPTSRAVNQTFTFGASPNVSPFDIDGDGVNDLDLIFENAFLGLQNVTVKMTAASSTWFRNFGAGESIAGSGNFRAFGAQHGGFTFSSSGCASAPWFPSGEGFVGVKFELDPGVTVQGWLQLDITNRQEANGGSCTPNTGSTRKIKVIRAGWETDPLATSIATPSIMPVELAGFQVKTSNNTSKLTWETASETNNAGFEIERSEDAKIFKSISWIEGQGTTQTQQEYTFDDKELRTGQTYYYRLKQIDFDGTFAYSNILSVILKGDKNVVSEFSPNPITGGYASIRIQTDGGGQWTAQIFDAAGKVIRSEQQILGDGSNEWQLDLSSLSQGLYFVKFTNDNEQYYRKIMIE